MKPPNNRGFFVTTTISDQRTIRVTILFRMIVLFPTCETIVEMVPQRDHYYIGAKQFRKPAAGRSQRKNYYKKITN
jgi:hypothetical protein